LSVIKVLIYCMNFPPDAGSEGQLLQDLSDSLQKTCEVDLTVVCASVSGNTRKMLILSESPSGVKVLRLPVPIYDKSRKAKRVLGILSYFLKASWMTGKLGDFDLVLAFSEPPILGGMLGVMARRRLNCPMIYDIQDINPEQALAIGCGGKHLLRLMRCLDNQSLRSADRIILAGDEQLETIRKRKVTTPVTVIHNWADERIRHIEREDSRRKAFLREAHLEGCFVFAYSGNLGLYYGLASLLEVIRMFPEERARDGRPVKFLFIGAGAKEAWMRDYVRRNHMKNVVFLPYQKKEDLSVSLSAADVHLCPSAPGMTGISVPSKIFGILAAGKPVLGIMNPGSDARKIIERTHSGKCVSPGDSRAIARLIRWFFRTATDRELREMGRRGRRAMEREYRKEQSVRRYMETMRDVDTA
jgi:glycosyltransferase involved in cell wall biosynthesis